MMEKSKQQLVFDWLLKNREILYEADNSRLYDKFKDSGLSRNRLRSYKSRLKEKIESGEFDQDESVNDLSREICSLGSAKIIIYGAIALAGIFLLKFLKDLIAPKE